MGEAVSNLRDYPSRYLFCRAFRAHRWQEYTADRDEFPRGPRFGVFLTQRCNCGMRRYRAVTRATGEWLDKTWHYKAPPNYRKVPKGTTSANFRREYLRREPSNVIPLQRRRRAL